MTNAQDWPVRGGSENVPDFELSVILSGDDQNEPDDPHLMVTIEEEDRYWTYAGMEAGGSRLITFTGGTLMVDLIHRQHFFSLRK